MSAGTPTPEEIQKKLAEFMRQNFGERVMVGDVQSQADPSGAEIPSTDEAPLRFDFHHKPRDVKEYLDRFVIRQDDAKKALAIAVCDHYNHVRETEIQRKEKKEGAESRDYTKQNVILLGPTGVGKTYLIRNIAKFIGVPFVKADATKFSETGYVGGDVEDLVRELVQQADGNTQLAQYGIIYIDEIDKIASASNSSGRDVSGRGVQTNLLKLMEETDVPLRSPTDLTSQLQAAMEFQKKGKVRKETITTRHILFIVSGAFDRLEEIVRTRLKEGRIGFHTAKENPSFTQAELFRRAMTPDFVKFGFEPEFIGRLPVRVICNPLDEQDLLHILQKSEGSIIHQYLASFRAFGIEAVFHDSALKAIAHLASTEQTGARGLMTVCERAFREFKYHLPSTSIHRFEITGETVENPAAALEKVLEEAGRQELHVLEAAVFEFCTQFSRQHGIILRPSPETASRIAERAMKEKRNVRDVCQKVFKDYEFGLNLVKKNTGQAEFEIPPSVLDDPDRFLSDLVVGSYRKDPPEASSNPPANP